MRDTICLSGSKFFPSRADSNKNGYVILEKQARSHRSYSPFYNCSNNLEVHPIALNKIHCDNIRVPGRVAQSVGHLTRKSGVLGSIPGLATYFRSPSAFLRRAVVSYWRKYVHKVLVNRLGGLSLPRKSVVRLTDRPDMTLDVYRGRKTTVQQYSCTGVEKRRTKQPVQEHFRKKNAYIT